MPPHCSHKTAHDPYVDASVGAAVVVVVVVVVAGVAVAGVAEVVLEEAEVKSEDVASVDESTDVVSGAAEVISEDPSKLELPSISTSITNSSIVSRTTRPNTSVISSSIGSSIGAWTALPALVKWLSGVLSSSFGVPP